MSGQPSRPVAIADEPRTESDLIRVEEVLHVGRYRLCYELGSGGMATVYLARAEGPGGFAKAVAIKRIHPHLSRRKELVEMFLDEARIASLINHPNVCSTFDFGEHDGSHYLAMEYLVGEPLHVLLRRVMRRPELMASLRWQRTFAKILADVSEGLHAAHELKDEKGVSLDVVHRDVSPQNVFVTYDGVAKIVDFGVAFATDRIARTMTGGIKGKLGYLAPEQVTRQPYDRRVDVWALGILLWEGLTGKRLFQSRSEVDTILAVQSRVIAPPSQSVPGVPAALDAIALKALTRAPNERHATARAFGRELVAFLGESGPPLTSVDVSELLAEICGDRKDAQAEVVKSVLGDSITATPAPTPTPTADPAHVRVHEQATDIRRIVPALQPGGGDRTGTTVIASRLAVVSVIAVVAMAAVAVSAIWMLGNGEGAGDGVVVAPLPPRATPPPLVAPLTPVPRRAQTPVSLAEPVRIPSEPQVVVPEAEAEAGAGATPEPEPEPEPEAETGPPPDRRSGPARPRGAGTVSVNSSISVQACIRSRCAATPTVFQNVPAGRQTVRFRARDGRSWTESVDVSPNRTVRVATHPR